jgi:uncharacterized protein DUF6576
MPDNAQSHDYRPITWINRTPVYATTILTALFAVGVIVCAVLGAGAFLAPFAFVAPQFLHGAIWQPFTYAFVDRLNFFTPLGLFCFYAWAIEIEKHLGRSRFLTLFAMLIAAQPLLCLALWHAGIGVVRFGNYEILAAMLIGFATLYPNIEYLFGWVPLKWFAFVCFVAGSLMNVAARDWIGLSFLWVECGIAFGYIRWLKHGGSVELPRGFFKNLFHRKPKLRVLPSPGRVRAGKSSGPDEIESIDPLLDKIAKHGLKSLTAKEREKLERARAALLKRQP